MDGALVGGWDFQQVEPSKRGCEWYAHFTIETPFSDERALNFNWN
ncbi:MAG: hypothetical protein ACP5T2_06455 [Thermoprotei archaeon]